mgnify:CR=1 FL=1
MYSVFFFQAEDGIRDLVRSRGLGDVYKRQGQMLETGAEQIMDVAQRYLNIEKFTEVVVEPQ